METLSTVPKQYAYEAAELIKQCSIDAGKELLVPLSCDVEISDRWYGEPLYFNEKGELINESTSS